MQLFTVFTALFLPLAWASPHSHYKQDHFAVGRIVKTSSGAVVGHAATNHSEVSEYLGVPYAQPPVGDLRFAAPVKYVGSSILNGSVFGPTCHWLPSKPSTAPTPSELAASNITNVGLEVIDILADQDLVHSEDCLYLNVWSKPQLGEPQKAVMVFIHGGAFDSGTSSNPMLNGAALADRDDVIVVSLNYRLSIFGFPGNPTTQNNVAFLDQRLAMEWVRDNIANFGGDPARITLFGQSAGAASVDFYSYAWTSDPIAAGIILESGTSFSFELPYSANTSAASWYVVTTAVGCGNATTDSSTLLSCMRDVDVDSLLDAVPATGLSALLSAFGPTVDHALVFANYSQQTPASIPVLVGSNDNESGLFRTEFALSNSSVPDFVWDMDNLAEFTCPAGVRANASIAANNPTWRYRFFGVFPNINVSSEAGAYHGAELQLIFGTTFSTPKSTVEEINFEAYIRGAWVAFAKDPVNGLTTYEGGWPLYDPAEESLIRLGYDNLVGTNLEFPIFYDVGCPNANLAALITSLLG
ncbi:MAG: hypothetical protein M1818_001294 [Claussenomyces sp. TS43310]|nr:MAG: hypothetical protein M1818_001294 [Claussenomyces sp. TS43310]